MFCALELFELYSAKNSVDKYNKSEVVFCNRLLEVKTLAELTNDDMSQILDFTKLTVSKLDQGFELIMSSRSY